MTPSIGRIVHYHPRGTGSDRPQPALVVDVAPYVATAAEDFEENGAAVYLVVYTRSCATFPGGPVRFDPNGLPGTWRWPPRVEPRATLLPPEPAHSTIVP